MTNVYDTSMYPLGSTKPKPFYNNASNFDDAVNAFVMSWVDRFGRDRRTWWGFEQDFNNFLINSGFESVHLTYVDGVPLQVDRATQLIDRAGLIYRVKMPAVFPVMLSGTWATDQLLLVDVADAALRQALAAPTGASLIGTAFGTLDTALQTLPFGYEYTPVVKPWGTGSIAAYNELVLNAGTVYRYIGATLPKSLTGVFENEPADTWVRAVEDMSAYSPGPLKTSDLTSAIRSGLSVLITGDSLSFNAYAFPSAAPLLPAGYAWENPYGLASWGHMIRDSIYASGFDFTLAKDCQILYTSGVTEIPNAGTPYTAPYNNQLRVFSVASNTDEIKIRANNIFNGATAVRLMFFTSPTADQPIAKFDIYTAGVLRASVDTQQLPTSTNYRGRFQLNIDNIQMGGDTEIAIRNVSRSDGLPGAANVQFIGYTTVTPTVRMSGHGGFTSGQILADYETMIGQYDPDLVFCIAGANDIALGVPVATYKANMEQIVKNIRADKPNADIVLLTTTPMDVYPNRFSLAGAYCDALYQVASKFRCYYLNLYDVFERAPTAVWRHDNVHTSIAGGNYIYKAVRELVFPGMKVPNGYITDAQFQVVTTVPQPLPEMNSVLFSFNGSGDPVVPAAAAKYIGVTVSAGGEVTVTPRGPLSVLSGDFIVSPPGQFYMAGIRVLGTGGATTFSLVNLVNPPTPVTAKSQLAGYSMVVTLGAARTY